MKVKKKLFIIIIIFAILQCFGMFFTNSVHAGGIFDNAIKSGKKWKVMGSNSTEIENFAQPVFDETDTVYDTARVIVATIIIAVFAVTMIFLNLGSIQDKAKIKLTLGISFAIALIFLYAEKILGFFIEIFETLENM